jgi:hypothetical protein
MREQAKSGLVRKLGGGEGVGLAPPSSPGLL